MISGELFASIFPYLISEERLNIMIDLYLWEFFPDKMFESHP